MRLRLSPTSTLLVALVNRFLDPNSINQDLQHELCAFFAGTEDPLNQRLSLSENGDLFFWGALTG
jgi:hypothetical protein